MGLKELSSSNLAIEYLSKMAHPPSIETNTQRASKQQIHAAIVHQRFQNYECAITLAAAAEGMLPATDEPHFYKKVKAFSASIAEDAQGAKNPNDVIVWLKHGTYNGKKCETATIDYSEPLVVIWRAISKFYAVYGEVTPTMESWANASRNDLAAEKTARTVKSR